MGPTFKSSNGKYLINPEKTLASNDVCLATEIHSGREVVVKILKPGKSEEGIRKSDLINGELILVNKNINHPNIITYIDIDRIVATVFIFMPKYECNFQRYMVNRSLWGERLKHKKGFPDEEADFLFRELCKPIEFLHSMKIAHRDVKLENYLVKTGENGKITIVLADFGFSYDWSVKDSEYDDRFGIGSPVYMAPELVCRGRYKVYLPDIWALGVCLYILLTGWYPFWGRSKGEVACYIREVKYTIPENPSKLFEIVKKLLVVAKKRPSINEIFE